MFIRLSHSALPLCDFPLTSLLHLLISGDHLHLLLPAVSHHHSSACQYTSSAGSLTHRQIVFLVLMTLQHFSSSLISWFRPPLPPTTSPRLCPGKPNSLPSPFKSSVCVIPGACLPVAVWRFTAPASSSKITCSPTFRYASACCLWICLLCPPACCRSCSGIYYEPVRSSTASPPRASGCKCVSRSPNTLTCPLAPCWREACFDFELLTWVTHASWFLCSHSLWTVSCKHERE